jgi:hypothetical protein
LTRNPDPWARTFRRLRSTRAVTRSSSGSDLRAGVGSSLKPQVRRSSGRQNQTELAALRESTAGAANLG